MNGRRLFPVDAAVMVALIITSVLAFSLAPAAKAQSVIMAGASKSLTVKPGDTIETGFEVAVTRTPHPADKVAVTNAVVRVSVSCPDGSSQTVTINVPDQTVMVAANSSNWSPGGSVIQAQTTLPSTLCHGRQGTTNGATFMANFKHKCQPDENGGERKDPESARGHSPAFVTVATSRPGLTATADQEERNDCCHEHCFRFHIRRHHKGEGDEDSDFDNDHCENQEARECETPERHEERECCKERERDR